MYEPDYEYEYDEDDGTVLFTDAVSEDTQQSRWTCRRITFIVVTLLIIFSLLAITYLPGLIAASRRAELDNRPTPTLLPSA